MGCFEGSLWEVKGDKEVKEDKDNSGIVVSYWGDKGDNIPCDKLHLSLSPLSPLTSLSSLSSYKKHLSLSSLTSLSSLIICIDLLKIRLDISLMLLGRNLIDLDKDTRLFDIAKLIVDGGAEHLHCR